MNFGLTNSVFWIPPLATGLLVFVITLWYEGVWGRLSIKYVNDLMPLIKRLNIDQSRIPYYLRLWGGLIILSLAICVFALPLGIAAVFFTAIAPKTYLNLLIARRRMTLRDQLVLCSRALADTARAGLSLSQGLQVVQDETPLPLKLELETIVSEHNLGLPLTEAIDNTKSRLQHESFTLLSTCLLTSLERGGNTARALDRIARSLLETQRLERKMEADTAGGKRVLVVLASFPIIFLGIFMIIFPDGTWQLLTSFLGQIVLLVVIALVYLSVTWGQKIMKLE